MFRVKGTLRAYRLLKVITIVASPSLAGSVSAVTSDVLLVSLDTLRLSPAVGPPRLDSGTVWVLEIARYFTSCSSRPCDILSKVARSRGLSTSRNSHMTYNKATYMKDGKPSQMYFVLNLLE
jgi:hypothetical protein